MKLFIFSVLFTSASAWICIKDSGWGCVEGQFCNYDVDDIGFCEVCENVNDCNNAGLSDKGAEDCVSKCASASGCTEDSGCVEGQFCNYDFGDTGSCEECENVNDCNNAGLPDKGAEDCLSKCASASGCTEDSGCVEGQFCNYDFGDTGFCQECFNVNDCNNAGLPDKGAEDCLSKCASASGCTKDSGCVVGQFCNYDFGDTGFCQECYNLNDCNNAGLPDKGAEDCVNKCSFQTRAQKTV